jgi:dipeptidyl aminopeptidase/acylaminoacyl peptidase
MLPESIGQLRQMAATLALIAVAALALLGWRLLAKPDRRDNPSGLKPTQVTAWPGLDIHPALAPDGRAIAYSSDHSGAFEIYVKPLVPGSREIQITADGEQNFEPAWSPDGQYLAYHSMNRHGVCVVPASGGKIRPLTAFGSRPAWSPDGKRLAFCASDFSARSVWTVSSHGDDLKPRGFPSGAELPRTVVSLLLLFSLCGCAAA